MENNNNQDEAMDLGGIDLSDFGFGEDGAQMLSSEKLKEINKKLPKWSIEPPAKYNKK